MDVQEDLQKLGYDRDKHEEAYIWKVPPSPYDYTRMDDLLHACPNIRLVIIETLDSLLKTEDIKDNSELRKRMQYFMDTIVRKYTHQAAFVGLLQNRKSHSDDPGKRILGATQIRAMLDTKVYLDMKDPSDRNSPRFVHTSVRRGANIPKTMLNFDPITRRLTLGKTMAMELADAKAETRNRIKADIYKFFAEHPDASFHKECFQDVKGDSDTVREVFREMKDKKLLVKTRNANRNHSEGYRIAEIPREGETIQ